MDEGRSLGCVTVDFELRCWRLGGATRIHPTEWRAHALSRGGQGWKQRLVD
jgi:hypothetical protein